MNCQLPTQAEFDRMLDVHQARMQNDDAYPLKERINFSCVDLGPLDLSGRDLRGVNLERCMLSNDLSDTDFSGSAVINCCFHDAILQGSKFDSTLLTSTSFRNCDLSRASFQSVRGGRLGFNECDMTGARCGSADFRRSGFDKCNLSDVDMHHANLKKAIIESCEVAGLCLCGACVEKAEFYRTNMLWIHDSMPWSNICINAKSMCIGDRCGTHDEWFSETVEEVESYLEPHDYPVFVYNDWARWAPALKLICEQVRIGIDTPRSISVHPDEKSFRRPKLTT